MYIDIIKYKLADGVSEDHLAEAALDILEVWMKKQEGFLGWDIGKSERGYTDFVYWQSKEHADKANVNMKDIPPNHKWMKCYDMKSITSEKVSNLMTFKND